MDELLMRGMPHSAEAEQAVLGSMLIDGDCVKDVMDQLQAEDFYLRQNREIFETIAHMFVYSQPVDGVTVASEMEKNGLYTDATRPYLLQLMEVTPTSANVGEGFSYHKFEDAANEQEFNDFVSTCKKLAFYDTGVTPKYGDKLLCLSTCEYTLDNGRLVVAAVRIS